MAVAALDLQPAGGEPMAADALFDPIAFDNAALLREPFDHLYVPGFLRREALALINRDYPEISRPGNFKPEELRYGPTFQTLVSELRSAEFAGMMGDKFGVDLQGCETTLAVRKFVEATDGNIHTDHRTKVITMLIYFNESWEHDGGRLRMLRSATDMEDFSLEVEPAAGNMVAFRRTDKSYHGHKPHVGERRFIQVMWAKGGGLSRTVSRITKPVRRMLNMS